MYSRALHRSESEGGGEAAAAKFADDVLSVFLWTLLVFSAIMMIAMPAIGWIPARDYKAGPGKFQLAVFMSPATFPSLESTHLVALPSRSLKRHRSNDNRVRER